MAPTASRRVPVSSRRQEGARIAREHGGHGRRDAAVHAPEHGPAPQEAQGGRVDLPEEDVHAARAGIGRGQFGAHLRAEQREAAGEEPGQHHAGGGRHTRGDLRGLDEHRGPDDGADDQRRRVRQPDDASEADQSGLSGNIIVRHMCAVGLSSFPSPSLGCLNCRPMMSMNGSIDTFGVRIERVEVVHRDHARLEVPLVVARVLVGRLDVRLRLVVLAEDAVVELGILVAVGRVRIEAQRLVVADRPADLLGHVGLEHLRAPPAVVDLHEVQHHVVQQARHARSLRSCRS